MPTRFAPPPLAPPPASSWARVRGTPAGGGEGFSERWGELRSPDLSRSHLPSGEIQESLGWMSGDRGIALGWGKQSSRNLSGLFPPSPESKCDSGGRRGRGEWIRKGGAAPPPHPSGKTLPSPWPLRAAGRGRP